MAEALFQAIWLLPALPLLAALLIALGYVAGRNRGESGERLSARLALGASGLALLLILAIDLAAVFEGAPGTVVLGTWFGSGAYQVPWSFTLDGLGLVMSTLVALISFLTLRFSVNYMHREAGFQRFFLLLCLFSAAMLLIVSAGNAVLVFVGWELAGVSSFLLIGYAFERDTATLNANRAFVTNRVGDAGFILGLFLAFTWLGGAGWGDFAQMGLSLSSFNAGLLLLGFCLAAMAKSAVWPFSSWIARALEGPTPSSAIFYGSLMVHAGVYLLLRLQPLLEQVPVLMWLLALIGAMTALYGLLSGLVQTDVKSSLMFSTTAQVGLMFLACGLGWFEWAAVHLVVHALWRAFQFLSAPALMHLMSANTRPVPAWLQRRQGLYTAALQRFWLEHWVDWLLVKPTQSLAKDLHDFDERVVNRMVGLPLSSEAISSLAQWDAHGRSSTHLVGDSGSIGHGRGLAGRLLQWLASLLYWFEEHLVLKGSGEGLLSAIELIGRYLLRIEQLLSQPRYLLLLVMATFAVII